VLFFSKSLGYFISFLWIQRRYAGCKLGIDGTIPGRATHQELLYLLEDIRN
jgi:hypothetical protein